jgi:TusA-related sulfurtransferase
MPPETDVTLDAGVTACGDLLLLIVRQMRTMSSGQIIHVVAYDRGAAEDVPAWCRMTGNTLLYQIVPSDAAQHSHFYICKG